MLLGTRRFKTLVLTAAMRQILFDLGGGAWQQLRDFWRHALTTALTARALATLTRYPEADEAFMLGLLHNIGELIAIKTPDMETRQEYMNRQSEIAAEVVTSWGVGAHGGGCYALSAGTSIRFARCGALGQSHQSCSAFSLV